MKKLQNGSDIRGIAISTEKEEANLTPEVVEKLAIGIVHWLEKKGHSTHQQLKIAVGTDSRLSAPALKEALLTGLLSQGVCVFDTGLSTTPAMFMTTQYPEFNCDGAIMLTASHLPYIYNGLKFFSKEGGAEKQDIQEILTHTVGEERPQGSLIKKEVLPIYAADLVAKIRKSTESYGEKPLSGFHIIVDAGNGAGGFFSELVLKPLGAKTEGSQFLEPDGHFPNHIPNPDNAEAMASIREAVLREGADLGIIFDTDVDRAAVVDQQGQVLNRNNLIAVLATIVLQEAPASTIVTNSPTSSHLKTFIERLGGKQVRYLCGYRNVINKAIALNQQGEQTELAIETSGHAAFKENYFLDDGAYVIAKLLMLLPKLKAEGTSLSDLILELKQPVETSEVRLPLVTENYQRDGQTVIASLADFVATTNGFAVDSDNEEGIRVNVSQPYGDGWFLLRLSLHEPLLVLQVENDQVGGVEKTLQKLSEFLQPLAVLDARPLMDKWSQA